MKIEILKKHSAAIAVSNQMSLKQRKLWNVLLAHAYDELPQHEKLYHEITWQELALKLGWKNYRFGLDHEFRSLIRGLQRTIVEWNVLEKDKKENFKSERWVSMVLLPYFDIQGDKIIYGYAGPQREMFHNPRLYAKINLSLQSKFSSKYSLVVFELCEDYRGVGHTPWMSLDKFRELIIGENKYLFWKDLRKRVVNTAISEINQKCDFKVELETQREPGTKRKIGKIRFVIFDSMNEIKTPPEAKNLSLDDKTEKALDFLKLSYSKYGILDDGVCFQIKKVFKETGFQTTQQRLLRAIDFFQAKQITDQKRKIKITMSSLSGKWDEQTIH